MNAQDTNQYSGSATSAASKIAAAKARLAALEAQAMADEAMSRPELSPIVDLMESTQENRKVAKAGFSGVNSFDRRIESKQVWIAEIQAARDLAAAQVNSAESILADCSDALSRLASIQDPAELTAAVEEFLSSLDMGDVEELQTAADDARAYRVAYNAEKKAPKRKRTIPTIPNTQQNQAEA